MSWNEDFCILKIFVITSVNSFCFWLMVGLRCFCVFHHKKKVFILWIYIVGYAPDFICWIRVPVWAQLHVNIQSESFTHWQEEIKYINLGCAPPSFSYLISSTLNFVLKVLKELLVRLTPNDQKVLQSRFKTKESAVSLCPLPQKSKFLWAARLVSEQIAPAGAQDFNFGNDKQVLQSYIVSWLANIYIWNAECYCLLIINQHTDFLKQYIAMWKSLGYQP